MVSACSLVVMRIGSLELQQDLTPTDWVVDCIHDFCVDVGSIVPNGFESYARLLHPAHRREGDGEVPVRWSEIAAANGRTIHPEMQWPNISGVWEHSGESSPGLWDHEPEAGSLPLLYAERLGGLLAEYTSTPQQVWFCAWEGWGGLKIHPDTRANLVLYRRASWTRRTIRWARRTANGIRSRRRAAARFNPPAPTLKLPSRAYHLFSGPIEGSTESHCMPPSWQSANLWWPEDRAWFVATEIDFAWTYVGGSEALIQELIDDPTLEAISVQIDDSICYDSDRINPAPPPRP